MALVQDPIKNISTHFTYRDALWLPSWGRMGNEADGLTQDILLRIERFFNLWVEPVRLFIALPMIVSVAWRPRPYNSQIKPPGATHSPHMALVDSWGNPLLPEDDCAALDFIVPGVLCDNIRSKLYPKLKDLNIRVENNPGSVWVHMDNRPVPKGGRRFFIPY